MACVLCDITKGRLKLYTLMYILTFFSHIQGIISALASENTDHKAFFLRKGSPPVLKPRPIRLRRLLRTNTWMLSQPEAAFVLPLGSATIRTITHSCQSHGAAPPQSRLTDLTCLGLGLCQPAPFSLFAVSQRHFLCLRD